MSRKIIIRAFRAVDEPERCIEYIQGHLEVLKIFNVENVTSANPEWTENPGAYVVVAEDVETGEILGGIRMHKASYTHNLPIEEAVCAMDIRVINLVRKSMTDGAGELCGLWNSRKVKGLGLSTILTRVGIAITSQIGIKTVFGVCADFTLSMLKSVGYVMEKSLGNQGCFPYPTTEYNCNAIIIHDAHQLNNADPQVRDIIFDLRARPVHRDNETGAFLINFELLINYSRATHMGTHTSQ